MFTIVALEFNQNERVSRSFYHTLKSNVLEKTIVWFRKDNVINLDEA